MRRFSGSQIRKMHFKVPYLGETKMNNYEAAEMLVVGAASETILGEKVLIQMDNISSGDPFLREEELHMFDE